MHKRHIIINQNHGTIYSSLKNPNLPNVWHNVSRIIHSYPEEEQLSTLTGFLDQGDQNQVASVHARSFRNDSLYFVTILGSDLEHVSSSMDAHVAEDSFGLDGMIECSSDHVTKSNDILFPAKLDDSSSLISKLDDSSSKIEEDSHYSPGQKIDVTIEQEKQEKQEKQVKQNSTASAHESKRLLRPHSYYDSYKYASIQMELIYGILNLKTNFATRNMHVQFSATQHERKCIDYIMTEEWTSQAIRLGCWEAVELSNENAVRARDEITRILGSANECKSLLHSILICERKLVSMWSKYDTHILQPKDLNLLIIDSEIRRQNWKQQRAEYKIRNPKQKRKKRGLRSRGHRLTSKEQTNGCNSPAMTNNELDIDSTLNSLNNSESGFEFDSIEPDSSHDRKSEVLLSPVTKQDNETFENISPLQENISPPPNNESPIKEAEPTYDAFEIFRLATNDGVYRRFAVYIARISDSMTLVLIDLVDGTEEEKLRDIKDQIAMQLKASSYMSYVTVIAQHHLLTESYLPLCPGMIHFVLKDCVRQRILAPEPITIQKDSKSEIKDSFIRHHVWKMFQAVDVYRELGYTEMNICTRTAQYCFNEWLVDKNGNTLQVNENNIKDAVEHYELYTIYIPFVSLQAIQLYNQRLLKVLI